MDWIINLLDILVVAAALFVLCLVIWVWHRSRILLYRHLIGTAAIITFIVSTFLLKVDNMVAANFMFTLFTPLWIAAVGLWAFDKFHRRAVKKATENVIRYRARLDRALHWTIAVMSVAVVTYIVYDMLLHSTGTRIDLALADTVGFVFAFYCLEKARPQILAVYISTENKAS